MKAWIQRKRKASGAFGYVFLFLTAMILVILSIYLTSVAKLMTHQHHVDDALADSVLASLVADDVYYFETMEESGVPVLRFQNTDESHRIFKDCMEDAIRNTNGFYYNFRYDDFICYERNWYGFNGIQKNIYYICGIDCFFICKWPKKIFENGVIDHSGNDCI